MSNEVLSQRKLYEAVPGAQALVNLYKHAREIYPLLFQSALPWDTLIFTHPTDAVKGTIDLAMFGYTAENVANQEERSLFQRASDALMDSLHEKWEAVKTLVMGNQNFEPALAFIPSSSRRPSIANRFSDRLCIRVRFAPHAGRFGLALALKDTTAYTDEQRDRLQVPLPGQLHDEGLLGDNEEITGYGRKAVVIQNELFDEPTVGSVNFAAVVNSQTHRPAGLIFF